MRPPISASALLVGAIALAGTAGCGEDGDDRTPAAGALSGAAAAATLEPAFTRVSDQMLGGSDAAAENWLVHGGAYNNQRYSALTQINRENVADLVPVWIHQTGISESFATTRSWWTTRCT